MTIEVAPPDQIEGAEGAVTLEETDTVLVARSSAKQAAPLALATRDMDMAPASFDADSRTVDAVLSSGAPVRRRDWGDGEYDEVLGMSPNNIRMDRLNSGAPLLDSHDYYSGTRAIVGAIVPGSARVEGRKLKTKVKFSRSPDGERVMQDVRDGIIRHISVGYHTHGFEVDETTSPPTRRATDWEPHEASVVAIPADPRAGFRALDPSPRPPVPRKDASIMAEPATDAVSATPAVSAPSEADIAARADTLVKVELDRRDQIASIARRLRLPEEFATSHIEAKTPLDAFRAAAIEEKAKIEASEASQSSVGDGWEGREQVRGFPTILPASARKTPEPGQRAAQMVLAVAAAKRMGVSPVDICARRFGADSFSTRALQASLGSTGGYLIPIELSSELIELLRPKTVVRRACPSSRQISLPRGNLTIGRQNTGATVGYIGEGQSTAYTQEAIGDITFQAKKAKALVPISNDLIRFAQTSADMIVRDDLVRQLAVLEDQNFLRGVGSVFAPKGIRYLAATANIIAATVSAYSVTTMMVDFENVINAMESAYVPMTNPAWFWSHKTKNYLYDARDSVGGFLFRAEMERGQFRGWPFFWTQNIPNNLGNSANQSEIYLVDMDEFIIADVPGLMIDASQEASYSSDGSTLTNSAFDRDETVIRIIAEHDCNIKHTAAAAVLTSVPYGN